MSTLKEILPYLQELVKELVNRGIVDRVVLYGSYAKGKATRTSDVDMMVVSNAGREVNAVVEKLREKMAADGFPGELDVQVTSEGQFPIEHLMDGIQLWGKPICLTTRKMALRRKFVVSYDTTGVACTQKGRLYRALYGHRSKSTYGKKVYQSKRDGIVKLPNAERFGTSTLLVGPSVLDDIVETIRSAGAKAKILEAWVA